MSTCAYLLTSARSRSSMNWSKPSTNSALITRWTSTNRSLVTREKMSSRWSSRQKKSTSTVRRKDQAGNAGPRQHLDRHQRLQRAGDTSHQDRPARPAHQRKKRRDRNRCDGEGGAPLCADGGGHLQPEKTAGWVNARRAASLQSSSSESIDRMPCLARSSGSRGTSSPTMTIW